MHPAHSSGQTTGSEKKSGQRRLRHPSVLPAEQTVLDLSALCRLPPCPAGLYRKTACLRFLGTEFHIIMLSMNTGKHVQVTTRNVTRGAMAAAIYALLLFLNQQTALGIETAMPWLFIFPIYVYSAASPLQASFPCALAMILETFLFGGFTTWFYSWTGILSGFLTGAAIRRGLSGQLRLGILFVCQFVGNLLTMFLWAGIFDMDITEDFAMIRGFIPWLDMKVFIVIFCVVLSVMTAVCVNLLGAALLQRLHIPCPPITPVSRIRPNRTLVWLSIASVILFVVCPSVIVWKEEARNWLLPAVMCAMMYLDYLGCVRFLQKCVATGHRSWAPVAVIGAFVPGLQLLWVIQGMLWGLQKPGLNA